MRVDQGVLPLLKKKPQNDRVIVKREEKTQKYFQ